jgi:hypothetical protein
MVIGRGLSAVRGGTIEGDWVFDVKLVPEKHGRLQLCCTVYIVNMNVYNADELVSLMVSSIGVRVRSDVE